MAPIKFEENIKDKLEQRRLEPSSEAWSKLANRLENDEKPKSGMVKWLSIAAGILILVSVSVHFFNKKTDEGVIPKITNKIEEQENIEEIIQPNKPQNDVQVASTDEVEDNTRTKPEKKTRIKKEVSKLKTSYAITKKETITKKEIKAKTEEQNVIDMALIEKAIDVTFEESNTTNASAIDKEVDSLLNAAKRALLLEKARDYNQTQTVDIDAFLLSVEDEMGQSFRTRVYKALKEGFETVKTAVAERNQ